MNTRIIEIDTQDAMGNTRTLTAWGNDKGQMWWTATNSSRVPLSLEYMGFKGSPSDQRQSIKYLEGMTLAQVSSPASLLKTTLALLDERYVTRKAVGKVPAVTEVKDDKPVLLAETPASGMNLQLWCKPGGVPYLMLSKNRTPFTLDSLPGKSLRGESLRKALKSLKRLSSTEAVMKYVRGLLDETALGRTIIRQSDLP